MPVIWIIGPPCDVIETELLLGTDPTKLMPAGQPVYGFRTMYSQSLTVGETGVYWVAAYARDEDGAVIQSAPQRANVAIPPQSIGPSGSHGPLSSCAGNDDDFLRQAGNPHFASLRSVDVILQEAFVFDPPSGPTEGDAFHATGSTHPEEVRVKQAESLMVGQFSLTPNPADVQAAIEQLDQQFAVPNFFPRAGLYVVICQVEVPSLGAPRFRCDPDGAAYRQGLGGPPSGLMRSGAGTSTTSSILQGRSGIAPP